MAAALVTIRPSTPRRARTRWSTSSGKGPLEKMGHRVPLHIGSGAGPAQARLHGRADRRAHSRGSRSTWRLLDSRDLGRVSLAAPDAGGRRRASAPSSSPLEGDPHPPGPRARRRMTARSASLAPLAARPGGPRPRDPLGVHPALHGALGPYSHDGRGKRRPCPDGCGGRSAGPAAGVVFPQWAPVSAAPASPWRDRQGGEGVVLGEEDDADAGAAGRLRDLRDASLAVVGVGRVHVERRGVLRELRGGGPPRARGQRGERGDRAVAGAEP